MEPLSTFELIVGWGLAALGCLWLARRWYHRARLARLRRRAGAPPPKPPRRVLRAAHREMNRAGWSKIVNAGKDNGQ